MDVNIEVVYQIARNGCAYMHKSEQTVTRFVISVFACELCLFVFYYQAIIIVGIIIIAWIEKSINRIL